MAAKIATYKKGSYCQLKFPNGDRILVSVSSSGIKIIKLILAGIIPAGTIHEWRGREDYKILSDLFASEYAETQDTLDALVKFLSKCNSTAEVQRVCNT